VSTPVPIRDSHSQALINRKLPELAVLERLVKYFNETLPGVARIQIEDTVNHEGIEFPLYSIVIGTEDKTAPCVGVFGGVHGLERIGAEVVIAYLQSLSETLLWDQTLRDRLKTTRVVFMPIVNPVGMFHTMRANGNGVDLMRNSPVVAEEPPPFLLGGQTYSKKLPWFRGTTSDLESMEIESRALCKLVQREIFPSKACVTIDVHSGFGTVDRLWFPYAKSKLPPPNLSEITAMKRLFDRSYPNHPYQIEPQAKAYTTHGDLWDFLFDEYQKTKLGAGESQLSANAYIPWTLELGSWIWLKKNPKQFFSSLGAFNPIQPHRLKRILRRHLTLFDFLHRAVLNSNQWVGLETEARDSHRRRAMDLWYDAKN
jgi:Zinc carboxypeptidase